MSSYRLQVLITKDLDQKLRKAASRSQVSKGEWVRQAVEAALSKQSVVRQDHDSLSILESLQAPTGDIGQLLSEIEAGRGA